MQEKQQIFQHQNNFLNLNKGLCMGRHQKYKEKTLLKIINIIYSSFAGQI